MLSRRGASALVRLGSAAAAVAAATLYFPRRGGGDGGAAAHASTGEQSAPAEQPRRANSVGAHSFEHSTAKWRVYTDRAAGLVREHKLEEAQAFLFKAVELASSGFGANDPHTAAALHNAAECCRLRHDTACAVQFYGRAVDVFRSCRPGGPELGTALSHLAAALLAHGQAAEAGVAATEALGHLETALGDAHPASLQARSLLASVAASQGRHADSAAIMVDVASRAGHEGGHFIAKAAVACETAGLHSQAVGFRRELLRRAEEGAEDGGGHARAAAAGVGLAECLMKGGDRKGNKEGKEAVALLRNAVSTSESLFGREHPLVAARKRRLADALVQLHEHSPGAESAAAAAAAAKEEAHALLAAALPPLRKAAESSAAAAEELRACEESAGRLAK